MPYNGPPLTQFANARVAVQPRGPTFWGGVRGVAMGLVRSTPQYQIIHGGVQGAQNGGGFWGFLRGAAAGAVNSNPAVQAYHYVRDHAGNIVGTRNPTTNTVVPISQSASDQGPSYTGSDFSQSPTWDRTPVTPTQPGQSTQQARAATGGPVYGLGATRTVDRGIMGSSNPGGPGSALRAFTSAMATGSGRLGGMSSNNPLRQSGLGIDKTYVQQF